MVGIVMKFTRRQHLEKWAARRQILIDERLHVGLGCRSIEPGLFTQAGPLSLILFRTSNSREGGPS